MHKLSPESQRSGNSAQENTNRTPQLHRPISKSVQPNAAIADLPLYKAGRQPQSFPGLAPYKLSSNENPLGPAPTVAQSLTNDPPSCNRYPEPTAADLRAELAAHIGAHEDEIVTGTGSVGALSQLLLAFITHAAEDDRDEVIYPWRSFEAYPLVIRTAGAKNCPIPLTTNGRHDLPAMAASITDKTRVILLCSPNNPTGTALRHEEVENFLELVPPDVLVIIDEAYHEFVRHEDPLDTLGLYRKFRNVAVLRTFSKAHGLAGLRVGYSIAHTDISHHIRKVVLPFAVSTVAESAAIASLQNITEVNAQVDDIVKERYRILDNLQQLGWDIPEAQGNFIWLPLGQQTDHFTSQAEQQALTVRAFKNEGVRITIGEKPANDRFIELCKTYKLSSTNNF